MAVAAPAHHFVRRLFDLAGAALILAMAAPVLLLGMVSVYLGSGRPIFFGHIRLGRNGRPFRCWKLRTMAPGAEQRLQADPALRHLYHRNGFKVPAAADPRITREGRWLRRFYVDEIPQLVNVLNGTMSLVGARPIVADELVNFDGGATELLRHRPGIVGAWTSRGRGRPPYPERALVEVDYLRGRTIASDLLILARSIPVVLRGQEPDA